MTADLTTPAGEAAKTRLVFALEWLFTDDDQWRPVPSAEGVTITLTRRWGDATTDLVALSPDTTYAVRTDPRGQEVTREAGTAVRVVAAVGGWPVPAAASGPGDCPIRVPVLGGVPT